MSLHKTSIDFITFLNNNMCIKEFKHTTYSDKLISNIYTTIQNTDNNYNIKKDNSIDIKLDKTKSPIIYKFFKKLYDKNKLNLPSGANISELNMILNNNDMLEFYNWFNDNHHHYIIPASITKTIKECYDQNVSDILLDLLYLNGFVPMNIILEFELFGCTYTKYTYDNITLNLFQKNNNKKVDINNIFHICRFVRKLSGNVEDKKISINIFNSNFKKIFDNKSAKNKLRSINVNSGSSIKGEFLNIYRNEELNKVLIHELIHFLYMDFTTDHKDYHKYDEYTKNFNIDGDINMVEVYVETLAIIIHSIYASYKLNVSFDKIINYEINFSCLQTAKILNYFDMNYNDIFRKPAIKKIYQATSAFSYYIIKASLLVNLENTLKFFYDNLNYKDRTDEFINLVNQSLKNNTFVNCINYYQKIELDGFIKKSLRMSCVEIQNE